VTRAPYAPERRRRRPAPPARPPWRPPAWAVYAERLVLATLLAGGMWLATSSLREARPAGATAAFVLPPVAAVGVSLDTVFFGGFARGSFAEALETVAGLLEPGEREMLGQHLDRIFARPLRGQGLGSVGRLRGGVERTLRPDGTTRALRVLAAEAAVAGVLHTAFFYEKDGQPSYFDAAGRSLDAAAWSPPLEAFRVSSPFGSRRMHPILGRVLPHAGVDYAAPSGTPVRAAADGSVARAGWAGGYGNLVELIHPDGQTTRYAHLQRLDPTVRRGGFVRRGEVIGAVGMTGLATGPHLHFEIRRQGVAVDPERALREAGIQLRVTHEPTWPAAREELSTLLARAPTVLRLTAGGVE
jgi:murein DD-endopeptidase MepM/ murein hydrolase activator NlpD